MSRLLLARLLTSFLLIPSGLAFSATDSIERGRYLVVDVAKCGDCHTQHLQSGAPDRGRWLKGGTLSFKPLAVVPGWASAAPDITSTSPLSRAWGDAAIKKLLMTGKTPQGKPAAPPMPAYTLKDDDASSIVDYLKSLK